MVWRKADNCVQLASDREEVVAVRDNKGPEGAACSLVAGGFGFVGVLWRTLAFTVRRRCRGVAWGGGGLLVLQPHLEISV